MPVSHVAHKTLPTIRRLLFLGSSLLLLAPASATAQSKFNGTWIVDFNSALPKKVNVWLLQNGRYACESCTPKIEVPSDGKDQPVKGQPYDTISVNIIDTRTVEEVEKKNGQVVSDETLTVSDDGNALTDEFANWKVSMARVAKAPGGAHQLSGSWQPLKVESSSDKEFLITYKLEHGAFSMTRPTGESYQAQLNGKDAAYKGNSDANAVSVRQIDADTIEETDKLNGRVVSITRITVATDGKSMSVSVRDARDGSVNKFTLLKQ